MTNYNEIFNLAMARQNVNKDVRIADSRNTAIFASVENDTLKIVRVKRGQNDVFTMTMSYMTRQGKKTNVRVCQATIPNQNQVIGYKWAFPASVKDEIKNLFGKAFARITMANVQETPRGYNELYRAEQREFLDSVKANMRASGEVFTYEPEAAFDWA